MPLPTEQFAAQARRAGRAVSWRIEAGITGLLAVFIALIGLLFISSVPWFGIIALLIAISVAGYGIRRVLVGRHRDLICPNCGGRGELLKIQQSYQFHCARCEQTADTGISSSGVNPASGG